MQAFYSVQENLGSWGEREFGNLAKKVRKLQKNLERLRMASVGQGPNEEEKAVAAQLREALRQEEIWIKQRSRVLWLRAGDRNTDYFHAQASQRKRINRITSLQKSDGQITDEPEEVRKEIHEFYQDLYQSQGYNDLHQILQVVPRRISDAMNELLAKDFMAEEVKTALFQMAPSKSPGVDGFTAGCFQRHWEVLGGDITAAILDFLNGGELPIGMNDTAITLIPKVRNPQRISQYRPIALCPVLYKIGAKAGTNRLRGLMDEVIGAEQSAFIPGWLITDNVLVAYESIHTMKKRKKGKNASCAVKLDMLKAYDRVEWHYLEAMMIKLGFCDKFVRLIMKCVSSVRFTVKVNGTLLPYFTPSRGLRQGDPYSPFLFLICAEGFTSLMNYFGGNFVDRGIRVSFRSPWVNHLLFADDSLIFLNAQVQSAECRMT